MDIVKGGIVVDGDLDGFLHVLGPRDVFNPLRVENVVGDLGGLAVVAATEDGVEEGDVFYFEFGFVDVDAIADVEGV